MPRGGETGRSTGHAARMGCFRRAAGRCERASRPRLGPGLAPAFGDGFTRTARGLQRQPAENHRLLCRARAERRPVRQIQGARRKPGLRHAVPRAPQDRGKRAARLPPGRRRAARRQEGALHAGAGGTRPAVGKIRGEPARRHQRLCALHRGCGRARRCAGRCPGNDACRRRSRRQARLENHPADAVLPAGDAIRRPAQPARNPLPCLRHARLRIRQGRLGQYAAD